jgi:hypothetical protein
MQILIGFSEAKGSRPCEFLQSGMDGAVIRVGRIELGLGIGLPKWAMLFYELGGSVFLFHCFNISLYRIDQSRQIGCCVS